MSNKGVVLRADVSGKIVMKTYLSGMPECKVRKKEDKRHGRICSWVLFENIFDLSVILTRLLFLFAFWCPVWYE